MSLFKCEGFSVGTYLKPPNYHPDAFLCLDDYMRQGVLWVGKNAVRFKLIGGSRRASISAVAAAVSDELEGLGAGSSWRINLTELATVERSVLLGVATLDCALQLISCDGRSYVLSGGMQR